MIKKKTKKTWENKEELNIQTIEELMEFKEKYISSKNKKTGEKREDVELIKKK